MITLTSGSYKVILAMVDSITCDSSDYDTVYLDQHTPVTLQSIKLYKGHILCKSILVGGYSGATAIHSTSQVCDGHQLAVCCSDKVFCFSIPNLDLIWATKADEVTCFEIFKYEADYIVHGEIEISRLNSNGDIVWQRSGADIFTTLKGENDFIITPDYIRATDFGGKIYRFDFDGNNLD